jgi:hypothetical protein
VSTRYFQQGLAALELRAGKFDSARELLDSLPSNVVPLNLYRLHLEAAVNRNSEEAGSLWRTLSQRTATMTYLERQTLDLVDKCYCLHDTASICTPDSYDIEELYEIEIELSLVV